MTARSRAADRARSNTRAAKSRRSATALFCAPRNVGSFFWLCRKYRLRYFRNIDESISRSACHAWQNVYKGIAGSVLHTFVLLSGMRAGLFRLCYARSMPMLFASRSASRSWVCCSYYRGPLRVCGHAACIAGPLRVCGYAARIAGLLRVCGYAARIVAVRFASVGMLLVLPRSASRLWVCCSHCRGPLRVREYAACIAGSLRVRRDRGDAVSLTLQTCLPRVLPVSTLRDA